jgi:hypothetical protein
VRRANAVSPRRRWICNAIASTGTFALPTRWHGRRRFGNHGDEAGRHIVYAGSFFPWKGVQDLVAAEWRPAAGWLSVRRTRWRSAQVPRAA